MGPAVHLLVLGVLGAFMPPARLQGGTQQPASYFGTAICQVDGTCFNETSLNQTRAPREQRENGKTLKQQRASRLLSEEIEAGKTNATRNMTAEDHEVVKRLQGVSLPRVQWTRNITGAGQWVQSSQEPPPFSTQCPNLWKSTISGFQRRRQWWSCESKPPVPYRFLDPTGSVLLFNALRFVKWLGNRSVLFLGDSLLEQLWHTVVCPLQPYVLTYFTHRFKHWRVNSTWYMFAKLITGGTIRYQILHRMEGHHLQPALDAKDVDLLVFMCGQHYNTHRLDRSRVYREYRDGLSRLYKKYQQQMVIFMPNLHWPNCEKLKIPQPKPPNQAYYKEQGSKDKYGWGALVEIRRLWRGVHNELKVSSHALYVDPLDIRPDAATYDCLHLCLPGPLDLQRDLLYTFLLARCPNFPAPRPST